MTKFALIKVLGRNCFKRTLKRSFFLVKRLNFLLSVFLLFYKVLLSTSTASLGRINSHLVEQDKERRPNWTAIKISYHVSDEYIHPHYTPTWSSVRSKQNKLVPEIETDPVFRSVYIQYSITTICRLEESYLSVSLSYS